MAEIESNLSIPLLEDESLLYVRKLFREGSEEINDALLYVRELFREGSEEINDARCCGIPVVLPSSIWEKIQVVITPVRGRQTPAVPDILPTKADLDRFKVLKNRAKDLHVEGQLLVKELESHFEDFLRKIVLATALSLTGSISVGIIACSIGLVMAIIHGLLLLAILLPVYVIVWGRVLGTLYQLSLVRGSETSLHGLVTSLRTRVFHQPTAATPLSHSGDDVTTPPAPSSQSSPAALHPPGSPEVLEELQFGTNIEVLVTSIEVDLRVHSYKSWYIIFLVAMTVLAVAYCVAVPWLFYTRVCAVGKALMLLLSHGYSIQDL